MKELFPKIKHIQYVLNELELLRQAKLTTRQSLALDTSIRKLIHIRDSLKV